MDGRSNEELRRIIFNTIDYRLDRGTQNEATAAVDTLIERIEECRRIARERTYTPDEADVEEARKEWTRS